MKSLNQTWLVQRLLKPTKGDYDNPFAFGGGLKNGGLSENAMKLLRPIFSFDYMGSAEFEFGAIPAFFKEIAENIKQYSTWEISIKTIPIYVISRTSLKGDISNRILELSKNNGYSLKEYSGIADAIDGENKAIMGWLELDNNFMFFIDKSTFEKTASLFELNTETNEKHPHRNRRTNIHIWLLCLIGFIIFLACSCSPKFGCPKTRGMIGVSLREAIDKYHGSWVKCNETGIVCVFNPEGKLIGYYTESK